MNDVRNFSIYFIGVIFDERPLSPVLPRGLLNSVSTCCGRQVRVARGSVPSPRPIPLRMPSQKRGNCFSRSFPKHRAPAPPPCHPSTRLTSCTSFRHTIIISRYSPFSSSLYKASPFNSAPLRVLKMLYNTDVRSPLNGNGHTSHRRRRRRRWWCRGVRTTWWWCCYRLILQIRWTIIYFFRTVRFK